MSRLRTENLSSRCLAPVNLAMGPGECVCISGPSGTGKSALLRAIADLDLHEGTVYLDDTDCQRLSAPEWRRLVGMLPSESVWWYDRVREHFTDPGVPWLEKLGLDRKILDHRVGRLSTGERQRLSLLRLLANRPRALLLDEPTASLDTKSARRAEALIAAYRQEHQAPILWVSHDPHQIRRVSSRHFRIREGRLVEEARR